MPTVVPGSSARATTRVRYTSQMARVPYAEETDRRVVQNGLFRTFGPASPRSARASRNLRRTIYPIVATWRPTRRGIRVGRRAFERVAFTRTIRGTRLEPGTLGGVPIEWTVAPRASAVPEHARVVLYLHGGGYVIGSPRTHRNLTSRLSHVLATPVASVDYRMAPEVGISTSFADCLTAYRALLDDGYPAEGIVIAGDSAGGGLAAGTALGAIDAGLPAPAAVVLLSPWLDLANTSDTRTSNYGTEAFIAGRVLFKISDALLPSAERQRDWRVSPFHAPDELLRQLPPTLIQVGTAEVLAGDGITFAERMAAAGARVELEQFVGQGHVVAMWTGIPEARRALKEIARWVKASLPSELEPSAPSDAAIVEATSGPDGVGPEDLPA